MGTSSVGIKSLSDRLASLEDKLTKKTDLSDIILNNIEEKKREKNRNEIEVMRAHFLQGIITNGIDPKLDFLKLCTYSIHWIENNISKLAKLMNIPVTSDLKLDTATSLLKSVDIGIFNDVLIERSIDYLVTLLYPKKEHLNVKEPDPVMDLAVVTTKKPAKRRISLLRKKKK